MGSMRSFKIFIIIVLSALVFTSNTYAFTFDYLKNQPKEKKVLYLNAGIVGGIMLWGVAFWNYGQSNPHGRSEHGFAKNSPNGGADKLGHLYTSYLLSHALSNIYSSWGYEPDKAAKLGALSSFTIQGLMEIGDAYSSTYGFAYDDLIANAVGSYIGYLHVKHPDFARKIDVRVEYFPSKRLFKEGSLDFTTDYDGMKFLIAAKLDGFSSIQNKYLKYLEIHLGYFSRGYGDATGTYDNESRNIYAGIGLNISKILNDLSHKKTAKVFNYYQLPYTYLPLDRNLNN
ncbi:hypothetical protein BMS3Abin09_00128 [bacterium BMS3Abin09]|nr:hypothetical protein BMS3Abin09_00128 [bacterium BMS3Abin09]